MCGHNDRHWPLPWQAKFINYWTYHWKAFDSVFKYLLTELFYLNAAQSSAWGSWSLWISNSYAAPNAPYTYVYLLESIMQRYTRCLRQYINICRWNRIQDKNRKSFMCMKWFLFVFKIWDEAPSSKNTTFSTFNLLTFEFNFLVLFLSILKYYW